MSQLALLLLGSPRLERGGVPIVIDRRKAMALIAYLAVTGQSHHRDGLATLLWPEYDQSRARAALRRILVTANKALAGLELEVDREAIGLQPSAGLWLDVDQFHQRLAVCRTHGHPEAEVCMACLPLLTEAVALYRADFMAGFTLRDSPEFDEWQFFQTEGLRRELAGALERLVYGHSAQGDAGRETAIAYGRRWLGLDSLHEPAQQQLMQLYAQTGQRAAALRQYEAYVQILEQELGTPPSAETTALYERIRSGDLGSGAALTGGFAEPQTPYPQGAFGSGQEQPLREASQSRRPPMGGSRGDFTSAPLLPRTPAHLAGSPPQNLPAPTTPFLGREAELTRMAQYLANPICRLLTLVGPGGSGKTRLALQAAAQNSQAFPDGVYFTALASISSPDLLIGSIMDALNCSFYDQADLQMQLLHFLRQKELLLVLDNFEHLLSGVGLVADILTQAPKVKILVTSRERLNLQGEWLLEVWGLEFPTTSFDQERLEAYSAVQLFVQAAQRVRADLSLSAEERTAVVRICQLVQGMPLGLELAAAWVRVLSCREIAEEIERCLDFLVTPLRDVPERHRSLRAVFMHSWNLLAEEERRSFRQLSVFRGGFRREAAEQVAGASLSLLSTLVDKSLLWRNPLGRYEMHELLRQYAAEKLHEADQEQIQTQTRHSQYYAQFLQNRETHLKGRNQKEALTELGAEIENIRASWCWAVAQGQVEAIKQSLESLFRFYEIQGRFQEASEAFEKAAASLEGLNESSQERMLVLGQVLARQGALYSNSGLFESAKELLQKSLEIFRRLDAQKEMALALNYLGFVSYELGDYAPAKQLLQESLTISQRFGDWHEATRALDTLGYLVGELGEYAEAKQMLQESLALHQANGYQRGIANSLNILGYVLYLLGEYQEAKQLLQESLAIRQEIDDRRGVTVSLDNLGYVAVAQGAAAEARGYFHPALKLAMDIQAVPLALDIMTGLAKLLAKEGQKERAVTLLTLVMHHPRTEKVTKDDAARLLAGLGSEAIPQGYNVTRGLADAGKRGDEQNLNNSRLLASPSPACPRQFTGVAHPLGVGDVSSPLPLARGNLTTLETMVAEILGETLD